MQRTSRLKVQGLVLAAALLGADGTRAHAWAARVHRFVAYRALGLTAASLPLGPARAWSVLAKGAVAPDLKGPGRIPPNDHVFHPRGISTSPTDGGAPRRAQALMWALEEDLPDVAFVFELGRICHLAADLCQPLHTDGGPDHSDEPKVHGRFEADADLALCRTKDEIPCWAGRDSPVVAGLERVAAQSHARYETVMAAYRSGAGLPEIESMARERVSMAVAITVQLWTRAVAARGRAERARRRARPWAVLAVVLVLVWFAGLRPERLEASRWPAQGKVEAAQPPPARAWSEILARR